MLHDFSLATGLTLFGLAAHAVSAIGVRHVSLTSLRKRDDGSSAPSDDDAWAAAWGGVTASHQSSFDYKTTIQAYMSLGVRFYGLYLPDRHPVEFDESDFIPGSKFDGSDYPDGAWTQLQWCTKIMADTAEPLVKACTASKCSDKYSMMNVFGTWDGMNWKKDGVMITTCALIKQDKVSCDVDNSKIPYPPSDCKMSVVQDFTHAMWSAHPESNVVVIGQGQTSIGPISSELAAYAKQNGLQWSLPS